MIDVCIRSTGKNMNDPLRRAMRDLTNVRWRLDPLARVGFLYDKPITELREFMERYAVSDPYIITDDDVMIVGRNWIERGEKAMLAHPDFAVCSSLSLVEGENLARGQGEIYDMHAVGAPMWIRKGVLTALPEMTLDNECGTIHKIVLDRGRRMGLINGLRHNHLGHGFSSNPALHWGV